MKVLAHKALLRMALSATTVRRYALAVRAFTTWLRQKELPMTMDELDDELCIYFYTHFRAGGSRQAAAHTYHGLCHFMRGAKGNLPGAALSLRGWTRARPSQPFTPMPWPVAVLLAVRMVWR